MSGDLGECVAGKVIDKLAFAWHQIWLWLCEWRTGVCHLKMWILYCMGDFATEWLTHCRNCPLDGENQIEICCDKAFLFTFSFFVCREEEREAMPGADEFIRWITGCHGQVGAWKESWTARNWEKGIQILVLTHAEIFRKAPLCYVYLH